MKSVVALAFILLTTQMTPMPKNNPNGTWESGSGTQYRIELSGTDLKVKMVSSPNGQFLSYEVNLKNSPDETNTYNGSGSYVEKVKIHDQEKECKFDTTWQVVVVNNDHIIGATSYIVHDVNSCAVTVRQDPPNNPAAAPLELKKK
jgi:hypothetical protein